MKRKGNTVQLLAVDGIELEILIAESDKQLVRANGGRPLAEDGTEVVVA